MIKPKPMPFSPPATEEGQLINTLEPHISFNTVGHHYKDHYLGYVKNLNKLITGTVYEDSSLEEMIKSASGPIFNNAAQTYNHEFYFNCLTPDDTSPSENLEEAIEKKWGSIDNFKKDFTTASKKLFGSGWTWLVWDTENKNLLIMPLENAGSPVKPYVPLLCYDLWEHNYYLQFFNDRAAAIAEFWHVCNWDFVNTNFKDRKND